MENWNNQIFYVFRRLKEEDVPYEVKRQRFHSPHRELTSANHLVPLIEDHRYSFPGSISSPLFQAHYISDLTGCVPPLREPSFNNAIEATLPVAKDKVRLKRILFIILQNKC